jgi:hypothetical protein
MISSIGDDVSATVRIDLGHFVLAVARCQRVQVFAYDVASFEVVGTEHAILRRTKNVQKIETVKIPTLKRVTVVLEPIIIDQCYVA